MSLEVRPWPRPEWSAVPREGCVGVESRLLVHDDDLAIAMLRFAQHATIDEHPGPNDTIVVCLEGEGFTAVGGETAPLREGQRARWPKDVPHRLWTEGSTMTTLMVERPA